MNFLLGVLIPPLVTIVGPSVVMISVGVVVDGVGVVVDVVSTFEVVVVSVVVVSVGGFVVGAKERRAFLVSYISFFVIFVNSLTNIPPVQMPHDFLQLFHMKLIS